MDQRPFRGRQGGRGRGGFRGGTRGRGHDGRVEGKPEGSWRLKIGYRRLNEVKEKQPYDVLVTLKTPSTRLKEALDDESHDSNMIELFLRCIAIALECESQPQGTIDLLMILERSLFLKLTLMQYIIEICSISDILHEKKQPIEDIIIIFLAIAQKMPSSLSTIFGLFSMLEKVKDSLEKSGILDENINQKFTRCSDINNQILAKRSEKRKRASTLEDGEDDDKDPPNDFREMNVSPQTDDVAPGQANKPFLRRNKISGHYNDLDHYLDVQFRLLREDFISPLRNGIREYIDMMLNTGDVKRLQDLRIYDSVQILSPVCDKSGLCYRVCFDSEKLKRVRWESSKRLIFGSLVCLSRDRFKTMLFASVANRNVKEIQNGVLDLKFENSHADMAAIPNDARFVMAETTAYFEAYKHVLRGLQQMQNLPFERFIVRGETEVNVPEYLRQNVRYDLRPLIEEEIVLEGEMRTGRLGLPRHVEPSYAFSSLSIRSKSIDIKNLSEWPTADQLHLDNSQYKAVQTALTNEFVITQGPPGTGKTYIGLKIVKALLHNYRVWNTPEHRPMLIVCYTNHALDQFLEGIIQFYKGDVLRVGGRSSSEVLKNHNLNTYRMQMRKAHEIQADINKERKHAAWQLNSIKDEINKLAMQIEVAERELIHEDYLQPFMGQHYRDLVDGFESYIKFHNPNISSKRIRKSSAIVEWLGYGSLLHIQHGNIEINEVDVQPGIDVEIVDAAEEGEENEFVDIDDDVDQMVGLRQLDDEIDELLESEELHPDFEIEKQLEDLAVVRKVVALNVSNLENADDIDSKWQINAKQKTQMKKKLRKELRSVSRMTENQVMQLHRHDVDVWSLTAKEKWRLYRHWTNLYCNRYRMMIRGKEEEYERNAARLNEIHLQEDRTIMSMATIVGMTTTGAAKYQSILQEIRPRIIVVEEAAEVLEAHVITTLSQGCQHLILIGDHKQLKPNPTVYELARDYNLEISLFERMVKNGMKFDCLQLQHRMRPEISKIMKIIYPELQDHDIVKNYPNVRGISENMYFIHHDYPESNDEERRSHSNMHEAQYIVALCRYLRLQGYETHQITILTLYSGQLFKLRRLMPKHEFQGIRVTVVDNFQGEENDIILLSLVRSNDEGKIGFLKIENRVCVALSRAKIGLYVIGNLNLMSGNSSLWRQIIQHAKSENKCGEGLHLYCQNHKDDEGIHATEPEDFRKAPEGGCRKPCDHRLPCGHTCARVCHIVDKDHTDYKCRKPCQKKVCNVESHRCQKFCYQNCGDCSVLVLKMLDCGHEQMVPCGTKPYHFKCTSKCEFRLPCGHFCQNLCGERHTKDCQRKIPKSFTCGHSREVNCYQADAIICTEPCKQTLECLHCCQGTCGECLSGRLHVGCKNKCDRILVCGHKCPDSCSNCPPCKQKCINRCVHSGCPKQCGEVCIPCVEKCVWTCPHHSCSKRCYEPCDRPRCNEPCKKILECKHPCIGLCGEPCPSKCRICNQEEVTEIVFGNEDEEDARFVELEDCKHVIEVQALDHYIDNIEEEHVTVQMKVCPLCKTPIRKNMRYGSAVRKAILDIEEVKKKILGDERKRRNIRREIPGDIKELSRINVLDAKEMTKIYNQLCEEEIVAEKTLLTISNQIKFLNQIKKLEAEWGRQMKITGVKRLFTEYGLKFIADFRNWVVRRRLYFTEQELKDAQSEFFRLTSFRQYLIYIQRMLERNKPATGKLRNEVEAAEGYFFGGKKLTEDENKRIKKLLEDLKEQYPHSGLGVSEEERLEIVKAIGLTKGHWFKCPNGHFYAIGECGGANQEAKCGECNARIGGANHALVAGNQLANEVDGAPYAAWSDQANLENYQLDFDD